MKTRADEIRKRVARRKRERERMTKNINHTLSWAEDEERYGYDKMTTYDGKSDEGSHPLFRKEWFLFKLLASACLFLIIAIMFKNEASSFDQARSFVRTAMEKDFQFVAVSNWYEEQFGKPLALLPVKNEKNEDEKNGNTPSTMYALPASAKILEEFDKNGQRITIETEKDAAVEAMSEGLVTFAGKKEGFGKTVIIKHADNSESWYGNLADIRVKFMDYINKGEEVGVSTDTEDGNNGLFYFAIKKDDDFIDPIQVMPFD
ncbi:stage IV sporulation protein FA [Cytobacillus eiseniae]|uniref:Stage IV sporulation protein FA n=1 Tax=Cytobacillus eiseniae TaxID=762947 RepID=A0ABS4RCX6_9BACI|nr:M23 family metallopeptidase [Cytobacillus eiseniae]MBP2240578.1 stage IV sporulation protein FA [Cytobacillus eiseniae]